MLTKIAKTLAALVLGALVLYGFGRFFMGQLGGARTGEPAGVIEGPPPGYEVVELGGSSPVQAAERLQRSSAPERARGRWRCGSTGPAARSTGWLTTGPTVWRSARPGPRAPGSRPSGRDTCASG